MNNINIKAFGIVAEKMETVETAVKNVSDVEQLLKQLKETYPAIKDLKFTVAVDQKHIHGNMDLANTKEVALLPPFSGG
ncbi:MoaD/ThiS family protein [Marivirga sp.]|uniref:MoaD/ThiS family protein n=1 Tax=Marivirga sp. TaxID=2018662 RepID=UPI002D8044ED|nr:MoaD/ThiS family protein [Marivirga sp.]HET8860930.1 MoaD/ThiS family protein [Marivirga sp.]